MRKLSFFKSPFVIVGMYFFIRGVILGIDLFSYEGEPGLGGLIPFLFGAFGIGFFVLGAVSKLFFRERLKIKVLVELLSIILFALFLFSRGITWWIM